MGYCDPLRQQHGDVTRRWFLQLGAVGVAGLQWASRVAEAGEGDRLLAEAVARLEYLTPEAQFLGGGRGNPPPYELTAEQRRAEIGRAHV